MTTLTTVDYWDGAACRDPGVDPEWFFQGRGANPQTLEKAKATCRACPIQRKCDDWITAFEAQSGRGRHGFWAGMSARERARRAKAMEAKRMGGGRESSPRANGDGDA